MLVSVNGNRYEGEFQDNMRHGEGILFSSHGKVELGKWNNGKITNNCIS